MKTFEYKYEFEPEMYKYILSTNILNRRKDEDKIFKSLVAGLFSDKVLLITMVGHIVCAKYGVVYDSFDCRDRVAEYCWIVK